MFTKNLMISGLRRQRNLLNELIQELEASSGSDFDQHIYLTQNTNQIAGNLRQLREIKDQYALYLQPLIYLD